MGSRSSSHLPGQKALWVIDFPTREPTSAQLHVPAAFPTKHRQSQESAPLQLQAHDFLQKIQEMCNQITRDCQAKATNKEDILKKGDIVKQELIELDSLIKKLKDMLKWFKPPEEDTNH